jgi:hypothetical protein
MSQFILGKIVQMLHSIAKFVLNFACKTSSFIIFWDNKNLAYEQNILYLTDICH